ncbi:MAG: isoleucine--tRNA ligase, partial [Candidatus Woesearchaeota archaeon]
WEKKKIYQKAKRKNKGKKQFYFLDGPPYTSGRVHIGTAWNKALKDSVLRYKRMTGFDAWDRAGYDMHGMPTEQGVEKELGIRFKEEIPKFGVEKFVRHCQEFAVRNMHLMTKDFRRLGVWMDFDNPYQPITREYIEGEWWLIKQAHKNKRLYEGEKTIHWCAKCGTALAKHELEYEADTDDSIFLKFPVVGKENEFLIIWTTTPWTIPFNLAVMANPTIEYIRARVEDEVWILAKGLAPGVISSVADKRYEIVEGFTGDRLAGTKYRHPFYDDIPDFKELEKQTDKLFTVVLSEEYVDLSAGSGLVHMAPGCGPEDYEVGYREGIPPFNNLDEAGTFPAGMGKFSGWKAKKDDAKFIEALKETGHLIATTKVEHDYAHCWRCKKPVIFRTTVQWFFKVEDLKDMMREQNKEVFWQPDFAGSRNFDSWLANLRDNGITRQRFWGTPLPIWRCDKCSKYVVIGSVKELVKFAGTVPENLHKPWIDAVKWSCKCSGTMQRIPDILDVWVDSGTASWNCLGFPQKKSLFNKLFPADFILEGIDQIRGWFNLLLVASMVSMEKPSFKAVYMHGFVQDSMGRKMSKSLGNYILPEEIIEKYGADTLRFYMIGGAQPGIDLNYNFEDMKVRHRNLTVLWNLHNFLLEMNSADLAGIELGIEEKYILSRLNSSVKKATQSMDSYKLNELPDIVQSLFLDISRTYIQMVRDKAAGSDEEKKQVYCALSTCLLSCLKMMATICPMISERMYQNLRKTLGKKEESIHLFEWPAVEDSMIDLELEEQISVSQEIVQPLLRLREKAKLGVRWPLLEAVIVTKEASVSGAVERTAEILKKAANIKEVVVKESMPGLKITVRADFAKIEPVFGDFSAKIVARIMTESAESIVTHIQREGKHVMNIDGREVMLKPEQLIIETKVPEPYLEAECRHAKIYLNTQITPKLESEGFAREITRRVQQMRKLAGLVKTDEIVLDLETGDMNIEAWKSQIREKVGAKQLHFGKRKESYLAEKREKIRDREIGIFFDKI